MHYNIFIYSYYAIATSSLLVNLMVVCVMLKKRQFRGKKSNIFLLNVFNSYVIREFIDLIATVFKGEFTRNMSMLAYLFSYWTIGALSGDRLLAVKYPMLYQRTSHKYTMIYGITCTIVSIVMIFLYNINYIYALFLNSVIFILIESLICIANLMVRQIVKEKFNKIGDFQVARLSKEKKSMELKKTRICLILAFSFLFFCAPTNIMDIVFVFYYNYNDYLATTTCLSSILFVLNSIFDPVFYIIRSKQLRTEIKECIRCQKTLKKTLW